MAISLNDKVHALRALHRPGSPLVLPNVWDAGSAEVVAEAGHPAVATASAAIAAMLGRPDHEGAPADEMFAAAERVARAVDIPVTVDAEGGYGLPEAELLDRLAGIGAAGCNLEDTDHRAGGLRSAEDQAGRIARLRGAARSSGRDLVVNARVDVFIGPDGADPGAGPEAAIEEALDRGRRYLEAGADCVYPIMAPEPALAALADGLPGPVNAVCFPGGPGVARLTELGVARITFGPVPYLSALDALKAMAVRITDGKEPFEG